ncbi:MAG: AI-2E family transporter [Rhodoluna sp.]|jgi:predicted PurR-regulated permease PerM|nr:AI-2E family transporter [Rhodoluna sp.]
MTVQNMKIASAFQLGLFGGLGVLTALVIGGAVTTLANVITYVFAAVFLALGLDPLVSKLEKFKFPRPLAVLTVIVGLVGFLAFLIWSLAPTLITQSTKFLDSAPDILRDITKFPFVVSLDDQLDGAVGSALADAGGFLTDSANWPSLVGGVVQVGISLFNGAFGFLIILVLTVFFLASLESLKASLTKLVPASKRERYTKISQQVSISVGRYVIGQVSVAALNATLAFIAMSIVGLPFALVLAFIVFLLAIIPLVGSVSGAALVVMVAAAVDPTSAIVLGIYFLIYLQIEAYVVSPRVMKVAVSVPAPIVVIAALSGGALLGILGALVAIPFAASVIFIVREIFIPRQNSL